MCDLFLFPFYRSLNQKLSFEFEGDGSRLFELVLPPPHTRSLTLLLRAKNLHGASDISVNLLVSHTTAAPSFSDHEFRYALNIVYSIRYRYKLHVCMYIYMCVCVCVYMHIEIEIGIDRSNDR